MVDERRKAVAVAMRKKSNEISNLELNSAERFDLLAEEALKALDEYYGAARYWMSAEFEREKVLNELQATIDRIRNAGFSA